MKRKCLECEMREAQFREECEEGNLEVLGLMKVT